MIFHWLIRAKRSETKTNLHAHDRYYYFPHLHYVVIICTLWRAHTHKKGEETSALCTVVLAPVEVCTQLLTWPKLFGFYRILWKCENWDKNGSSGLFIIVWLLLFRFVSIKCGHCHHIGRLSSEMKRYFNVCCSMSLGTCIGAVLRQLL